MTDTGDSAHVAEDAVASGDAIAVPTLAGLIDGLAVTLLQGTAVAKAGASLGAETVRILLGRSEVAPESGDWRFKDPTWSENPAYLRIAQFYLAWCGAVDTVLGDLAGATSPHRA